MTDSTTGLLDSHAIQEDVGLELNVDLFKSEVLKRIVSEVAEERQSGGPFSNYDRTHNRHNR